jgi:dnd system-associated protein 4
MKDQSTIADAAVQALRLLGKPSSIDEIYASILRNNLYAFNTPTPEHVLRTTVRRHTRNLKRIDSSDPVLFDMVADEIYWLTNVTTQTAKKTAASGIKRIHRSTDKEDFIRAVVSDQVGVFKEIWKLLLFAAQVGFANDRREPLKSIDSGKGIDQSSFGNCSSWPGVIYLIALAETEKSESLSGGQEAEDSRINVFQEYANGGLSVMQDFFKEGPLDLDGLLAFIDGQASKGAALPDLELAI